MARSVPNSMAARDNVLSNREDTDTDAGTNARRPGLDSHRRPLPAPRRTSPGPPDAPSCGGRGAVSGAGRGAAAGDGVRGGGGRGCPGPGRWHAPRGQAEVSREHTRLAPRPTLLLSCSGGLGVIAVLESREAVRKSLAAGRRKACCPVSSGWGPHTRSGRQKAGSKRAAPTKGVTWSRLTPRSGQCLMLACHWQKLYLQESTER